MRILTGTTGARLGATSLGLLTAFALVAATVSDRPPQASRELLPPRYLAGELWESHVVEGVLPPDEMTFYRFEPDSDQGTFTRFYPHRDEDRYDVLPFTYEIRGDRVRMKIPKHGVTAESTFEVDCKRTGHSYYIRLRLEDNPLEGRTEYFGHGWEACK